MRRSRLGRSQRTNIPRSRHVEREKALDTGPHSRIGRAESLPCSVLEHWLSVTEITAACVYPYAPFKIKDLAPAAI